MRNGVLVLSGYGLRIAVDRGHLVVADGIADERRSGRLSRATCKLRRLVVLGHSGTISFEALRWLADLGAAFTQIDADGTVIAATAPLGLDDPRLRRAQALAMTNGVGLSIARDLLLQKLRGQAEVLQQIPNTDDARVTVERSAKQLELSNSAEQLRLFESQAASAYWQAWSLLPVCWARKDADRVPEHWRAFGSRTSPLTASPRSAANPANAILNYLYAILEAEARIALLSIGLDPGLGMLHADLRARDSLALDVMEVVRPRVDDFALKLLSSHVFATRDFFETRQGVCRILPPLTHRLAEMTSIWTKAVAPVAETIAHELVRSQNDTARWDRRLPTPLTEAKRSAGRKSSSKPVTTTKRSTALALPPACQGCGVLLDDASRKYCDECFPEQRAAVVKGFTNSGLTALALRRSEGIDPAHTAEAQQKRGLRVSEQARANAEWESSNYSTEEKLNFAADILPGLHQLPLSAIAKATGLSLRYCSLVRQGIRVPHRRHWNALADLCARDR